jgi:hypothetical protein
LLERAKFDRVCDEVGGVSDKAALLDFLHHNGVIFYRPWLFGGRIILDQNWALGAWRTIAGYEAINMIRKGQAYGTATGAKVGLLGLFAAAN